MKEKRKSSTGDAATPKSGGAKTPNKKVKAAADAEDDAGVPLNDTERAYLAWMKKKGVKLNGVSIGRFPHTGRGCVATRDIKEGDVLVEVPEAAIITADDSVAGSALVAFGLGGEALLHEYSPRLEREALVLAVMAEMSRGEESEFAPYLAALPTLRATHSPLGWSGAELAELEGTSALNRMTSADDESLELPSMTADHWKHVARPFLQRNPEFARMPGAGADDEDDDDDDDAEENARRMYLHATALVAGFSFTLGEDDDSIEDDGDGDGDDDDDDSDSQVSTGGDTVQAMVPFWDMLNHVEPERSSVRLNHDEDANTLQMIAIRPHAEGEEVFNTYGAAGDAELLRRYGFVVRRNPHGGGAEVSTAECLAAAEFARFESDMHEDDDSESDYSDEEDEDDDSEDRFDGKMPPISDSDDDDDDEEEEDDSEEDEEDGEEEDEEGDSDEEDLMAMDFRPGQIAREETLERLRMLRRWGILRNSKQTFEVSRTGKPSLALRYVARVLSMNRFQFRRLLAADAYERGERDDQEGAYSDEEDEDDDGFGDYKPLTVEHKPLTVEQVWNGDTFLTGETPDSNRLLGMTTE